MRQMYPREKQHYQEFARGFQLRASQTKSFRRLPASLSLSTPWYTQQLTTSKASSLVLLRQTRVHNADAKTSAKTPISRTSPRLWWRTLFFVHMHLHTRDPRATGCGVSTLDCGLLLPKSPTYLCCVCVSVFQRPECAWTFLRYRPVLLNNVDRNSTLSTLTPRTDCVWTLSRCFSMAYCL